MSPPASLRGGVKRYSYNRSNFYPNETEPKAGGKVLNPRVAAQEPLYCFQKQCLSTAVRVHTKSYADVIPCIRTKTIPYMIHAKDRLNQVEGHSFFVYHRPLEPLNQTGLGVMEDTSISPTKLYIMYVNQNPRPLLSFFFPPSFLLANN